MARRRLQRFFSCPGNPTGLETPPFILRVPHLALLLETALVSLHAASPRTIQALPDWASIFVLQPESVSDQDIPDLGGIAWDLGVIRTSPCLRDGAS